MDYYRANCRHYQSVLFARQPVHPVPHACRSDEAGVLQPEVDEYPVDKTLV